jgi:hypothetical protein
MKKITLYSAVKFVIRAKLRFFRPQLSSSPIETDRLASFFNQPFRTLHLLTLERTDSLG